MAAVRALIFDMDGTMIDSMGGRVVGQPLEHRCVTRCL